VVAVGVPVKRGKLPACAVLLAGGRGTRFWPRSRIRTPKQLLNIAGAETMLRETAARLRPLFPAKNLWVVTNGEQAAAVRKELPGTPYAHVLAEPIGRNTAAAIGLAAIHLAREHGDALMAVLPADHHISERARYRRIVSAALELAMAPGNLVVIGIPPTRPETGFGYIERGAVAARPRGTTAYVVRRFTEKPALPVARRYVASGRYFWNAGMFFWRVSTFLDSLRRYLPATYDTLSGVAAQIGTSRYERSLQRVYKGLENISVDYAIMERATRVTGGRAPERVFAIPAKVGWSDIGSWAAVYELLSRAPGENVSAGPHFTFDSNGNYFWSPDKFVAALGVSDLVLVDTRDAILLCRRERAQDVGKIVKWLEEKGRRKLI
jgi:mannose-1-phosphate guanylyltransferase